MSSGDLRHLILLGDVDELLREVSRRHARRDWEGLDQLRRACRRAADTGHQLWPVSGWVTYLLVLGGGPELAGELIVEEPPRFVPGPLTEVAAQSWTFTELAPHLTGHDRTAATIAQERVLRGEALDGVMAVDGHVLEVPLVVGAWEPPARLANYTDQGLAPPEAPMPSLLPRPPLGAPAGRSRALTGGDPAAAFAIDQSLAHLRADDDAAVVVVTCDGGVDDAVRLVLPDVGVGWADVDATAAAALLAHWGAGGPRRAGAAAGRVRMWWALAGIVGLDDEWPLTAEELGSAVVELDAAIFAPGGTEAGSAVGIAFADAVDGVAWAVLVDRRT